MGQQDPSLLAEVRIIDRQNHRVVAGPPALYREDAEVAVALPDLLIVVEGGSLIA